MKTNEFEDREIRCLDHGFVRLVDVMGDDSAIVQAARVSYGTGTKTVHQDRGLIRYLMRHSHTTPFEMVEFKFHVKLPIFVARQWIRHRTANVNEYSGRYSEMSEHCYVPDPSQIRPQSSTNKQGRSNEDLPPDVVDSIRDRLVRGQVSAYDDYRTNLEAGLARELARINLPVSNYTEWYWKIDLHNLFHFLRLRIDDHAQYEIRVYGEAIAALIRPYVPLAFEAFEDYVLHSMRLSRLEVELLKLYFQGEPNQQETLEKAGLSGREASEAAEKLSKLL